MRIARNPLLLYGLSGALLLAGCATGPVDTPGPAAEPEAMPPESEPEPGPDVRRFTPQSLKALPLDTTRPYTELRAFLPPDLQRGEHDWLTRAPRTVKGYGITLARIYYERGEYQQAARILSLIRTDHLSPEETRLMVRIAPLNELALQRPQAALEWLTTPPYTRAREQLPLAAQVTLLEAQAQAHTLLAEPLAAINARVALYALADEDSRARQNHAEAIWLQVLALSPAARQAAMEQTQDPVVLGWLDLGRLYQLGLTGDPLRREMQLWQRRHGSHPAQSQPPATLTQALQQPDTLPRKVAFLLPRSGPLATRARAIEDGFLAAWYQARSTNQAAPELLFFDSQGKDITQLLKQAEQEGAELVLGPLSRANLYRVERLAELPTPVIALNRTDADLLSRRNLLQFDLTASDQVLQLSRQAWQSGFRNAAILTPETPLGRDLADQFATAWRTRGGRVVSRVGIPESDDGRTYLGRIKTLLNIDQSEERSWAVRNLLTPTVITEARRRQDIDFIFMPVSATQGRTLKPLLNFQFAGDLPILALSRIIEPGAADRNADMAGIYALDIPWRLTASPIRQELLDDKGNYRMRHDRDYALGVDLYALMAQRPIWSVQPEQVLSGASGQLTLTDSGAVRHELEWVRIGENGVRQLAPQTP